MKKDINWWTQELSRIAKQSSKQDTTQTQKVYSGTIQNPLTHKKIVNLLT
jgi:hypothetical protein